MLGPLHAFLLLHCALGQRKLQIACESLGCVNAGIVLYIHEG